jgi:CDP-diacylglycerol--glycerol-3-phosphate 3-phosphatidyltransferase
MFIIVALMFVDLPWAATLAFWLFIVAALTDWLDGKLARERGEVSAFGRFMDAVIDKVMVIGLMIALVGNADNFMGHDVVAMMLLLCILCREFAISGLRMAVAVEGSGGGGGHGRKGEDLRPAQRDRLADGCADAGARSCGEIWRR